MKDEENLTKIERIKNEIKRLTRGLKNIDQRAKNTEKKLIENAGFMAITLEDLQNQINAEGTMTEYKNGENQYGVRVNPDVQTYNSMIKNYSSVIKQLSEFVPAADVDKLKKDDDFERFINAK